MSENILTDIITLKTVYERSIGGRTKDISIVTYTLAKTERITAVLHELLAPYQSQNKLANEVLRTTVGLVCDVVRAGGEVRARARVAEGLVAVTALVRLSGTTGLLSKGNAEVLIGELVDLADFLRTYGWFARHSILDGLEFAVARPAEDTASDPDRSGAYKGRLKDTPYTPEPTKETKALAPSERTPGPTHRPDKGQYVDRVQQAQKDRRTTILSVVQQKDRITIKDVAQVIKDVSEKTIQRELLALVAQGVLVKEGERRWSTYSFATR